MKKYFVTGLVFLLPLALTIVIVVFLMNFLTQPFVGLVKSVLNSLGIFTKGFWFLSASQVEQIVSQLLVLTLLFGVTVLVGYVTRWVIFHYFIRIGEYILHRIPLINTIYKTTQDVINTIFTNNTRSFKQVVLLPFPSEFTYAVGLITRENLEGLSMEDRVAVFVPTTPNPTSGFLMMVRKDDVIYLDMKVEEALKYVISCGVILGKFNRMTREEIQMAAEQMISKQTGKAP